jgi:ribosomal protein S19
MTRSLYKNEYISNDIFRKINQPDFSAEGPNSIVTRDRNTTITEELVGLTLQVYNGKSNLKLAVAHPDMVGYKFGEFIFTKRLGSYLHKKASAERLKKKKQKLLAKKQSKKAKSKIKKK